MSNLTEVDISDLVGKTIVQIDGCERDSEEITIATSDGGRYLMWHEQDCCEDVRIEDVTGAPGDLIGEPILLAEMVVSETPPAGFKHKYEPDSETWTFYKLATRKGYVDIRWFGSSNGYYSEGVSFARVSTGDES